MQILQGHSKIENTVRYLGVDIEDALTVAEGTEIQTLEVILCIHLGVHLIFVRIFGDIQMIDSSSIHVHQHGTNAKKGVRTPPPETPLRK